MTEQDKSCTCSSHQQPNCAHYRMGRCPEKPIPASVVAFRKRTTNPGNGALEKLRDYFGTEHNWPDHISTMTEADYFLAWLWIEGFKVVPLSQQEDKPP